MTQGGPRVRLGQQRRQPNTRRSAWERGGNWLRRPFRTGLGAFEHAPRRSVAVVSPERDYSDGRELGGGDRNRESSERQSRAQQGQQMVALDCWGGAEHDAILGHGLRLLWPRWRVQLWRRVRPRLESYIPSASDDGKRGERSACSHEPIGVQNGLGEGSRRRIDGEDDNARGGRWHPRARCDDPRLKREAGEDIAVIGGAFGLGKTAEGARWPR